MITDPLAYVPASVSVFMQADLEALASKSDLPAILDHETFQAMMPDSAGYLRASLDLLMQGGLDRSRPALVFQQNGEKTWRMVAGLGMADSLSAQLIRLGMPPAQKGEGFSYSIGKGMTVAWNTAIVSAVQKEIAPTEIEATLFALPDSSASANPGLLAFREKEGDLHIWADAGKLKVPLPWLGGLLENSPGMHTGMRMVNEKGQMAMHVDVDGMSPEQQGRMDRWFAAAGGKKSWERLPSGTPAWMSIALPEDPADLNWMDEGLFTALSATGTEAILAFHQIKLPQFYPRVSLLIPRRAGSGTAELEAALRQEEVYKGPGRLSIMGLQARYGMNQDWITASTTDEPSSLFGAPATPLSIPAEYVEFFLKSPIRLYVNPATLATVLPLPMITTELKDLALYAERLQGGSMAIHLVVRTTNPELYGLNTTAAVLLEVIPAVQMMNSFL